jgi:hypothetical protein
MIGANYVFNSGFPINLAAAGGVAGARVVRFFRGIDYPSTAVEATVDVPGEPPGSIRQDKQSTLSLRVEKKFAVGTRGRAGLIMDVLNVFNSPAIVTIQSLRTNAPNFLRPENQVPPRTVRLGIRYDF